LKNEEFIAHEGSSISAVTLEERIASSSEGDLDNFEPGEMPEPTTEVTKMIAPSNWLCRMN
jgi:hypothetical protein